MVDSKVKKIYERSPRFLQQIMLNSYDFKKYLILHGRIYKNHLNLLNESERWSLFELKNYQNKHLRHILRYAYENVPYYRRLYKRFNIDISRIKTVEDMEKLPIITKEDVLKNWNYFVSKEKVKFVNVHTSGTTGKPLHLKVSIDAYLLVYATAHHGRRFKWADYDGSYIARFVGDEPTKKCKEKKPYRKMVFTKRLLFPSYCLSYENIGRYINMLRRMKIKYLQVYPSTGYLLAKFLEYQDEYLPLKGIFYSSEPLYDFQRKVMEERFQTKLWGSYSQAENIFTAMECEHGNYHLTMIDGIMEVVRNNESLDLGEKGFVVATTLHNTAMPLIRYKLGDYTGYKEEECSCGRDLPLIYPVETKQEDFVVTPSGKIISPSLLTFPLKYARNIIESQIVQKSMDLLVVRIVRGPNYTLHDEENMVKYIKEIVGDNMEIKVEYVKEIYRSGSYKKRFVINELGGDYIERTFEGR